MITFITALFPEAAAVLSIFSLKKVAATRNFSLYENDAATLRLLITGAGKLPAAIAVTEYLARYSFSTTDLFCNFGICGGGSGAAIGDGFLCPSVTELTTGKHLYPEVNRHPFREALLFTADAPVNTLSSLPLPAGNLPQIFDMEAYGIATAMFRQLIPSRCLFYKVVSDVCNGAVPTAEEVTALLKPHLSALLSYLREYESALSQQTLQYAAIESSVSSLADTFTTNYPCSATMKHRLTQLLRYAVCAGLPAASLLMAQPAAADSPHKKKEALKKLSALENAILHFPQSSEASFYMEKQKKLRLSRHLYVEQEILEHPVTLRILQHFPAASIIPITHYKDVFNRSCQDLHAQETEPALILAASHGTHFYPGAPVCQSFGESHFLYTSCVMNCIYDCDYCYLQGMYPSGNLVVFVNLEDYLSELDRLLLKHPVYLCCSYDSDLLALSGLLPHAETFCRYAAAHPGLRLELRTKSAALPFIKQLPAAKNIIMAFTLSPQELIFRYEHYAPSLKARLAAAKAAVLRGFSLRICLDPVLDVPNAEQQYTTLVDEIFTVLSPGEISDISLGVFRLSKDYLKQLRKAKPFCAISHYPYELSNGVCHYSAARSNQLLEAVCNALYRYGLTEEKIFIWAPEESEEGVSHAEP